MISNNQTETRIKRVEAGPIPEPPIGSSPPTLRPLAERMATLGVPGVSVALIDGGALAWARGYGQLAAGEAAPVTERTIFQAASISKPVTAVAVMRLVQEGRLDLDEDVNRYLRSWKVPANDAWQPRLTLRHLLSHTAGTTVHGFPGYRPGNSLPTLHQVLDGTPPANTAPIRVTIAPGVMLRYSGGGTSIVQQVLVDLLDMPFPDLMRDLVLAPLGMTESTFAQPLPEDRWAQAARGHRTGGDPIPGGWAVYPEMAAAGLWTTPTDLARLALKIQRVRRGEDGAVLTKASVDQMLTPMFGSDCGIGFFLAGEGDLLRFGHTGGNEGFRCQLLAYADRSLGAVVMTNGDMGGALCQEVFGGIASEYGWPLAPGDSIGTFRPARMPTVDGSIDLAPFAGEYELRPDFRLRVGVESVGLTIAFPGQPPVPLVAASDTEFFAEALDLAISFEKDGEGNTFGLKLRQDGKDFEARRLTPIQGGVSCGA